jgi:aminoglycoside phosphotransferase (APT) family kinase protein
MQIDAPLPEFLTPDRLRALLERHWPVPADETGIEPVPAGRHNTAFFLSHPGRRGVLRIAPHDDAGFLFYEVRMMAQEPAVHQLVAEETLIPVPAVWTHDDTREILPRDFLILERLPGAPLSAPGEATPGAHDGLLRQLGRFVRELHAITGPQFGYVGAHQPMEPQRHWFPAFETMWGNLLFDVESCGGYAPEEAERLRGLLYRLRSVFPPLQRASLCHMDLGWENILVEDGRITGLLGWGRSLWGDPGIEFAVLDCGGLSRPAFWEGYGAARPNDSPARIRRKFYVLYGLQQSIVIERRRRRNPAKADLARRAALQIAAELEQEDG